MRILEVISTVDPAHGGPSETLRQFSKIMMGELGATVEVATMDDPSAEFLKEAPFKVHALGPGKRTYGYCPALLEWLSQHATEYDVVVARGLWQYHTMAVWKTMRGSRTP